MTRVLLTGLNKHDERTIEKIFKSVDVSCESVGTLEVAQERIQSESPTLVVVANPSQPGALESLAQTLKVASPTTPFIVTMDKPHVDTAMQAMRAGAYDCLTKPYTRLDVLASSKRATVRNGRILILPKVIPPKRRSVQILVGCLSTFLVVSLFWNHLNGPPIPNINLDSKFLAGLQWEGRFLWVGDWFHSTVTRFHLGKGVMKTRRKLETDSLFRMKDLQPIMLCRTNEALISICSDLKMRSHKWDVGLPTLQTTDVPGTNPTGLAWDGTHIWSADGQKNLLYQFDAFLRVMNSNKSLIQHPKTMTCKDGSVWILGGSPLQLAKLEKLEKGYVWRGPYLLNDWLPEGKNPSGMSIAFGRLWVVLEGDSRLISRPLAELIKLPTAWGPEKEEKEIG